MVKRRARPDSPLFAELIVSLPAALLGSGVNIALGFGAERLFGWPWWLWPAIYLALTPLVLCRPFEQVLVTLTPSMRRLTGGERQRLEFLVDEVGTHCGVSPKQWLYAIEKMEGINASTSGRHLITVTPAALRLPDPILAAVLAHELGHQVGGDTLAKGMRWWFLLPLRAATRILRVIAFIMVGLSVLGVVVLGLGVLLSALVYVMLLPVLVLLPLNAWLERRNEYAADRFAQLNGFGPALCVLLEGLADQPRTRGWRRLLDTHPHPLDRLDALQVSDFQ
jgi:Zn-dependent protease with chaperone function